MSNIKTACWSICSEKKQRINLSDHAYSIISQDMDNYDETSRSSFINRIVLNYCSDFLEKSIINDEDRFEKSVPFNITVCQGLLDLIYTPDSPYAQQYRNAGAFFKAIIEDYALLSLWEREAIYYKERIEEIQNCIDHGIAFKVKIIGTFQKGDDGMRDVRPYKILVDYLTGYHYLICYTHQHGASKDTEALTSYRISRLGDNIQTISKKSFSGKITFMEKKVIKEKMILRSPAFFQTDPVDVAVKFTKKGLSKYKKILYFRPQYTRIDKDGIYHFHCTEAQAQYYFLRLGGDVEILEPENLRKKISREFQKGYKMYFNGK